MKVDIWSDFVCPFCYIGKRRFEMALQQFEGRNDVEVQFRSFELDPNAKRDTDKDIHSILAAKYGMSYEKAKGMNAQVGKQAEEVGLNYRFDTMKPTNTFDAHRLAHYANSQGKMAEMTERILNAYFTDSLHIGKHETLAKLASEVGLDEAETLKMLATNDYSKEVNEDKQLGARLGITGVPFFVFNNKYAVSGAQPEEQFIAVLKKVAEEESTPSLEEIQTNTSAGNRCSDTQCD